jgi:cytochrome c-type biogenesis protein CcmF
VFGFVMLGAVFTILCNTRVMADALKGKFKLAGSAVAHIGFGLILVGAVIAAGTKSVVSQNDTGQDFGADFDKVSNSRNNIMLYRNQPVKMNKYLVTYIGDSIALPNHYFKVDYKVLDNTGKVTEEFLLKPNSQANAKMGLVSSPDTRHNLFHDLYTHVTMAPIKGEIEQAGHDEQDDDKNFDPPIADDESLKLSFTKVIPEKNKMEITVYQQPENKKPYIVMSAIDFPYINFFWSGTIIMVIGFLLSIFRRNKELKVT